MRSTLVEFVRFEGLEEGTLRKGDRYLRTVAQLPVRAVLMNLSQRPFYALMNDLRYERTNEEERQAALKKLSRKTTRLLKCGKDKGNNLGAVLKAGDGELQQIDFVANAAELSALPFEAALASDGTPLFLKGGGVVLTRRVRGAFADQQTVWPKNPKVLFIWSRAGGEVPVKPHRKAILEALEPWLPARKSDRKKVYVEIGDAKLEHIETVMADAKSSFTHIHILAHGTPVTDENDDRYGIALNHPGGGKDAVNPEHLARALTAAHSSNVVVTLAACDLGNQTDTITLKKSAAHELHVAGIPVVIASQLPLTIDGSEILVRQFYGELLKGNDVRAALHASRAALYEKRDVAGHDWVSLVGYVRLKEGYADYLEDVRLRSDLAALKNLSDKAALLAKKGTSRKKMARISKAIKDKIKGLEKLLVKTSDPEARDEILGLLGSAEKRQAELYFRYLKDDEAVQASGEALKKARKWYRQAFTRNPSHHWSGVQFLALNAALSGKVPGKLWTIAYRAAEVGRARKGEYWAQGSLAELALLGKIINAGTDESAETYLQEMKKRVGDLPAMPEYDPIESTRNQLRRYTDWWRQDQGFFPGTADLAPDAKRLAEQLKS